MITNHHYIKAVTKITDVTLDIPLDYKQNCINEVYRLGDSMNQKTNVKAIMSSYDVRNETEVFNLLINKILNVASDTQFVGDGYEQYIKEVWFALYKKGHHAIPHIHTPSITSFVYYLKSSGNTPIVFDSCNFILNPVDDMLVIFPSNISHSVPKLNEEEDRIVLAGNIYWKYKDELK